MTTIIDPVELSQRLIRCASVTPKDAGALDIVQGVLDAAGFDCTRIPRGGIDNLFARWGAKGHARCFGFNGHTDVVPPGDAGDWRFDPFAAEVTDNRLWGRGAADMKTGVAAFVAAAVDLVRETPPDGAIVVTVTGDEEGVALDGTIAILDWMREAGETMTACIVGEPTCPEHMGQMMKIGRRGSMTAYFEATGRQGHSAYPHRALNPVHAIAHLAERLAHHELDQGTDHFDATTLAITSIDTGNTANNVIPATSRMMANIRFNDAHSSASLTEWLAAEAKTVEKATGVAIAMRVQVSGESFLTPPGPLSDLVARVIEDKTGMRPEMSTSGGTSDARFIKDHCPVVEFGLVGQTMHQVDENVEIAHIHQLKDIYKGIIAGYFE